MYNNDFEQANYSAYFLSKIIEAIKENYYYDISYDELYHAAIKGMTEVLDSYSTYYYNLNQKKNNIENIDKFNSSGYFSKDLNIENICDTHEFNSLNKIILIHINAINEECSIGLKETINNLNSENMYDAIIDLRNNFGGSPKYVFDMCNLLVSKGIIFTSTSKKVKHKIYESTLEKKVFNRIIVLVNNKTMSAAELFAAVLQDDGAIVIGQKTYGKGVAQSSYNVYGGGLLKLTNEEYFRRNGTEINKKGITPDVLINNSSENEDNDIFIKVYNILKK